MFCDNARYARSARRGHRSPHVATEHLKRGWCDWETQLFISFPFDLKVNSRLEWVVIDPDRAALRAGGAGKVGPKAPVTYQAPWSSSLIPPPPNLPHGVPVVEQPGHQAPF